MNPEEIVKKLTQEGVLITPEIMDDIRSGKYSRQEQRHPPKPKTRLSVKIRKQEIMERMGAKDFISYYNNRFSSLRDILIKKAPSISVNKATDGQEATLTGMVRERSTQGFVLEDVTGEIDVVSGEAVMEDDVIAVRGNVREGKLFASEIIWPDVPLTNKPVSVPGLKLLLATETDDIIEKIMGSFDLVFVKGDGPNNSRVFSRLPNPCSISIDKEGKEFRLLVYEPPESMNPRDAVRLLKRRHLMPGKKEIFSTSDPFMIGDVPNLFWVISNQRHVEHYKGVTLVMSNGKDYLKFDAETGEVFFSQERGADAPKQNATSK